jgi:hypothetical protein
VLDFKIKKRSINEGQRILLLFSFIILGIIFSFSVSAQVAITPSQIQEESSEPLVYAPFYNENYRMDKELLNYLSDRLKKEYHKQLGFKNVILERVILIYFENSELQHKDDFVSWTKSITNKPEIEETINRFSKEMPSCLFIISYSPSTQYILMSGSTNCVKESPEDFLNEKVPHFDDLSSSDNREETKQWLAELAEYIIRGKKPEKYEKVREQTAISKKNLDLYKDNPVFLISDKDWKDVLPLIPVTVWTQQPGDNSECQRGYGTPENVCVYPNLIYHNEEGTKEQVSLDDVINPEDIKINGMEYSEWSNFIDDVFILYYDVNNRNYINSPISVGREFTIHLQFDLGTNPTYHVDTIEISDWKYPSSILLKEGSLLININRDLDSEDGKIANLILKEGTPTFVFQNPIPSGFDIDSVINFMQQYGADKVTIIGNTPQEIDNLLITQPELGAGVSQENIQRISVKNYLDYWESYKDVVYVENNYTKALMASTYASLLNAPLIIQGTKSEYDINFERKNIICIGSTNRRCDENYNLEQLQQKYIDKTNTDKVILVNPDDLDISVAEWFQPDKSINPIYEIYSKTSLASPILASAKHEVVLSTTARDYEDIDIFIEEKLNEYYELPVYKKIECKGGDSCSSGFEERTKEIYVADNSVTFTLPKEISGNEFILASFEGTFFDCKKAKITVYFYNNGKLIGSKTSNCYYGPKSIFYSYSGITLGKEDVFSELSPGSLELRFEGSKFAFNPESLYSVVTINRNDGGIDSYECSSIKEDCAPDNYYLDSIRGGFSDKTSFFNIYNINTNANYFLSVDMSGKNIQEASIYINDYLIDYIDKIHFKSPDNFFMIPSNLLEKNLEIKIEPALDESGKEAIFYNANIFIEPLFTLDNYLTIFASPDAIPMFMDSKGYGCSGANRLETDGRIYGSLNNFDIINLPVGRIMGVTSSDTSSYVARVLFFNKLNKNRDAIIVVKEDHQDEIYDINAEIVFQDCKIEHLNEITRVCGDKSYKKCKIDHSEEIHNICRDFSFLDYTTSERALERYARETFWTPEIRKHFDNELFYSGEEVGNSKQEIYNNYAEPFLKTFNDHGWPLGFSGMMDSSYLIRNKIYLDPSLVIGLACSTCFYSGSGKEFCVQGIRRGALAQQGAVDVAHWHQELDDILNGVFLEDKSIGKAYLEGRNEEYFEGNYNFCFKLEGDPYYALLGDPTWRPKWW